MKVLKPVLLALFALAATAGPVAAVAPFTIVAYPDSQNNVGQVNNEVTWTINNRTAYNIVFATHEGDITNDGGAGNMSAVSSYMHRLDGLMTWGTVPGNHDFYGISNYDTYFGPSQFVGKSWYGGSYNHSSWVTFQANNRTIIGLEIENNAPGDVLAWAQGVLNTHPANPVVLTTHDYLSDAAQARTAYGNTLWNTLVRPNNQIFMVLCGHMHALSGMDDGEWHQTSLNADNNPVFELLADYQDRNNGMMRVMTFDEDASSIYVKTQIANTGAWETDASSQFTLSMNFGDRLVPEPSVLWLLAAGALVMVWRTVRRAVTVRL